jgi:hypothetical protein
MLLITKDPGDPTKAAGKFLLCSIPENEKMLNDLLGVSIRLYKPSIPNLVYQYNFYSNYESEALGKVNEEIGF